NLIGSLPHLAQKAFDGVRPTDVAMHHRWKGVKGQQVVFVLHHAAYRFGIALLVLAFEGRPFNERLLFGRSLPDPRHLCHHRTALTLSNGTHAIALFMDHATLRRGSGKEGSNCWQ